MTYPGTYPGDAPTIEIMGWREIVLRTKEASWSTENTDSTENGF